MHAVTYHVVATDKGKAYFECEFNDIVTELTNDPIVALDPKRVLELDPLSRGQTVPIELRTLHCRAFDPQKRTQGPPVNTYGLPFLHVAFWPMILKIGTCSKNDPSVIDFCKCIVADAEAREIMIETHLTGMAREEALPRV